MLLGARVAVALRVIVSLAYRGKCNVTWAAPEKDFDSWCGTRRSLPRNLDSIEGAAKAACVTAPLTTVTSIFVSS